MKSFDFKKLFIFDLANNHQGDLEHGLSIIKAIGELVRGYDIRPAIKFQFRQLDTFIHPEYKTREDIKHIPRFISTKLALDDYEKLIDEVRCQDMLVACTPFDEESVEIIKRMGIDIVKIASCSITDWPLVEAVLETNMPIVASTGGVSLTHIDQIVHKMKSQSANFAVHHCVSIYPTPVADYNLNQIELLRTRYRDVPIGWSTHENPNDTAAVQLAVAKGAVLFERHVGQNTEKHKLNAYSSDPEQLKLWLDAYTNAVSALGAAHRPPAKPEEREAIATLARGVYAKKDIKKGEIINREDVFFAMPYTIGLTAGEWSSGLIADRNYPVNSAIEAIDLADAEIDPIPSIRNQLIGMLNDANIVIEKSSTIELSHHYGLEHFREHGAIIIDVVNREYCKKLIIQFPRQKHPYHYHKKKEETFQVLWGSMCVERDGHEFSLERGDLFLVEPNRWHKFSTLNGCIFEEISTTHYNNDSVYEDEKISRQPREMRKTKIDL